jgi:hypothetical protein
MKKILLGVALTLVTGTLIAANVPGFRLANGKIFIGDSSGNAQPITLSGDVTVTNAGVTSLAANNIVSADIDKSVIQVTNCQLTTTLLENLRGTPVACVPAPASGFATVVHLVEAAWDVTTTGETITGSNDDIVLEYATSGADVAYITALGFIDQTTDQSRTVNPVRGIDVVVTGLTNSTCSTAGCLGKGSCLHGWDTGGSTFTACSAATSEQCVCQGAVTPAAAEALQLKNNGDGEFSAGNAANTLSIRVWWSLVPTTAFSSGG